MKNYLQALNAPALTIKQFTALQVNPLFEHVIYNSIDGTFEELQF